MKSKLFVLTLLVSFLMAASTCVAEQNIALGADAKANSVYYNLGASNAVDGNYDVHWSSAGWASESSPLWMMVDLGNNYILSHVDLYSHVSYPGQQYYGYGINYNLYYSSNSDSWNNDSDWIYRASGSLYTSESPEYFDIVDFGGQSVRYLKFEVVGGSHWAHLYELEAYSTTPEPVSAALFLIGGTAMAVARARRRTK